MKKRLFAILSVWFATGVMASTIEMEYHDFYRHIQNLQHQDTEGLKYSFGFMHSHL